MRPTSVAVISIISVLVIYVIYMFEARKRSFYPFTLYVPPNDTNMVQYNPDPEPFDEEEIAANRALGLGLCNVMANTQNFVSLWCSAAPKGSGIRCDDI